MDAQGPVKELVLRKMREVEEYVDTNMEDLSQVMYSLLSLRSGAKLKGRCHGTLYHSC